METRERSAGFIPLADMHTDGVRFDPDRLAAWKKRGWKTAARKPVKNVDLWQALDEQNNRHQVNWHWVKGHAGIEGNEIADQLANQAIDQQAGENA